MADENTKPAPGLFQPIADERGKALGAKADERMPARVRVDNVWTGARASLVERFGEAQADRVLPVPQGSTVPVASPWDFDGVAASALDAAHEAERVFLTSAALGSSDAALKPLEDALHAATATFLNRATRGWEPRDIYEARRQREEERAYR